MKFYSTREAAKRIGVSLITLKRYMAAKKIPLPPFRAAGVKIRLWADEDIDKVRRLLPKIANGRKTRYQKLREKQKTPAGAPQPQHAKTARAGGPGPVPHKKRRPKKK